MFHAAYEKFVPGQGFVADDDKARDRFVRDATVKEGVVRWKENGRVPPADILAQWAGLNLPFDLAKSNAAQDADTAAFLKAYRAQPRRRVSAEERYEMRAAFGSGKRVVNILTGRVTRT